LAIDKKAPTGRNIKAKGAALGNKERLPTDFGASFLQRSKQKA
jgi:hypothetical protein